ncbi:hypothetical protein GM708_05605 [Vibrio cholerae]|nr:hypothetical protein [Vibrio cholerae]
MRTAPVRTVLLRKMMRSSISEMDRMRLPEEGLRSVAAGAFVRFIVVSW